MPTPGEDRADHQLRHAGPCHCVAERRLQRAEDRNDRAAEDQRHLRAPERVLGTQGGGVAALKSGQEVGVDRG